MRDYKNRKNRTASFLMRALALLTIQCFLMSTLLTAPLLGSVSNKCELTPASVPKLSKKILALVTSRGNDAQITLAAPVASLVQRRPVEGVNNVGQVFTEAASVEKYVQDLTGLNIFKPDRGVYRELFEDLLLTDPSNATLQQAVAWFGDPENEARFQSIVKSSDTSRAPPAKFFIIYLWKPCFWKI